MRIVTPEPYKVYKFEELSDEAKEKALDYYRYCNVDHDWWEYTYSDAEAIGLEITSFDTGRGQDITGDFLLYEEDVAKKILENHGEMCETYTTASNYLIELSIVTKEQCQKDADRLYSEFAVEMYLDELATEDINADFLESLLGDYLVMLEKEGDYLTSDECITELLTEGDYEFTEAGEIA